MTAKEIRTALKSIRLIKQMLKFMEGIKWEKWLNINATNNWTRKLIPNL